MPDCEKLELCKQSEMVYLSGGHQIYAALEPKVIRVSLQRVTLNMLRFVLRIYFCFWPGLKGKTKSIDSIHEEKLIYACES
jgi:hypothetical protein